MKVLKLILVLIAVAMSSCRNKPVPEEMERITRVRTVMIENKKISIPVHTAGIVTTSEEVKLSFKAGGIISDIPVREGSLVKKGEVLASLNLTEIKENVNIAEKAYDKALRDWNRAKNLYADTVATLELYQNATTALDIARSTLEIAKFNLKHSTITAPGNGIILKQLLKENELVAPGYPVFVLGLSGAYWKVKAGLADREVVMINEGDSASVTLDAYPGKQFRAEVVLISSLASQMTGTYEVELSLESEGYRLAAGFIAGVDIFTSQKTSSALVPVGSMVDADGNTGFLYSVNETGNAIRFRVTIDYVYGAMVAVSGIPAGIDKVVSEGAPYLKDGMKVEVVN